MNSITITLPLPPKQLAKNYSNRYPGVAKAKHRKTYRGWAKIAALHALNGRTPPQWELAIAHISYHGKKGAKKKDDGNIHHELSGAIDGIQDSGVIKNDRGLSFHKDIIQSNDPANPRVEITITPVSDSQAS